MHEEIENLVKQFSFEGEVKNSENLVKKSKFVIAGMGGSAHAALILKTWKPELDIIIHRNYDLPKIEEKDLAERLVILSSYSGNTEETLDAFSKAKEQKLSMAVVTAGGKLLSLAKENNIPYIEIPSGLQPRSALGLSTIAFLKFTGKENELKNLKGLTTSLEGAPLEEEGKKLADKLNNCVPVIYTSDRNYSLAYIWKIKLNETGKVPAFCNVFPELDHNEINGYDVKELNEKLYFIIL